MMNKQNIFLMAGILALASCTSGRQKARADYSALRKEAVKTTTVVAGGYDDALSLNGDVCADESLVRKIFTPARGV